MMELYSSWIDFSYCFPRVGLRHKFVVRVRYQDQWFLRFLLYVSSAHNPRLRTSFGSGVCSGTSVGSLSCSSSDSSIDSLYFLVGSFRCRHSLGWLWVW